MSAHYQGSQEGDHPPMITIHFTTTDGKTVTVQGPEGMNLLELAHAHDIDLEGACGGVLACSTCHCIVDPAWYGKLVPPSEAEEDMIDLASHPTVTSRLGCQIILAPEIDGASFTVPPQRRTLVLH